MIINNQINPDVLLNHFKRIKLIGNEGSGEFVINYKDEFILKVRQKDDRLKLFPSDMTLNYFFRNFCGGVDQNKIDTLRLLAFNII